MIQRVRKDRQNKRNLVCVDMPRHKGPRFLGIVFRHKVCPIRRRGVHVQSRNHDNVRAAKRIGCAHTTDK
jgi:hypothetical protein